jgi:SAM-dependent methyltransferase
VLMLATRRNEGRHSAGDVLVGMKAVIKDGLNDLLKQRGMEIVQAEILYDWQRTYTGQSCWHNCPLSGDAASYLKPDNARLIDLQQRYRRFDANVTTPLVWTDQCVRPEDIAYFRGDNAWVWQVRSKNANILAYAITMYYLKSIDHFGFLEKLTEDNSFGNFTYPIAGRQISRDVLDSIAEIYFLDRHLGISSRKGFRVLDIGAGYGRLAHRMVSALSGIGRYLCTDAVAASTFVSEYYLRFRRVEKASVIPLDEIDSALRDCPIDIAINVHSFSECRMQAIEWWARLLSKHRVKNLMVVPNRCSGSGDRLHTNDEQDFLPILEKHGYRTVLKDPKYLDPLVQEYGLYPSWHHLLELQT